jgi:hypothetical protein
VRLQIFPGLKSEASGIFWTNGEGSGITWTWSEASGISWTHSEASVIPWISLPPPRRPMLTGLYFYLYFSLARASV